MNTNNESNSEQMMIEELEARFEMEVPGSCECTSTCSPE